MLRSRFTCSLQLTVDMQMSRLLKRPVSPLVGDYLFAYLTMDSWLPEGWKIKTKKASNGSTVTSYYKAETKQVFFSKEDLMRYDNYVKTIAPSLHGFDDASHEEQQLGVDEPFDDKEFHDFMKATCGNQQSGNVSGAESVTDAVEAGKNFGKLENRPAKKRKEVKESFEDAKRHHIDENQCGLVDPYDDEELRCLIEATYGNQQSGYASNAKSVFDAVEAGKNRPPKKRKEVQESNFGAEV